MGITSQELSVFDRLTHETSFNKKPLEKIGADKKNFW